MKQQAGSLTQSQMKDSAMDTPTRNQTNPSNHVGDTTAFFLLNFIIAWSCITLQFLFGRSLHNLVLMGARAWMNWYLTI